jgi:hypothetical protein
LNKPHKRLNTQEKDYLLPSNLKTKTAFTDDIQHYTTAKLCEIQAVSPFEQFGQGVLNTPLPSPQQLSGLPLLLLGSPSLFQSLYSGTPQGMQTPIAQGQQPTTIGSLLNSAWTSASS